MNMNQYKINNIDMSLFMSAVILTVIGIVMIYSASSIFALEHFNSSVYFLKKQIIAAFISIIFLIIFSFLPYEIFRKTAYLSLIAGFVFLMLVHTGLGVTVGGATRWVKLIGGLNFQPSEFARLSLVIFLAYSLSKKQDNIKEFSIGFLPHVIIFIIFALLLLVQPDFGTTVIFCLITWIMMFIAGVNFWHLSGSMVPLLPLGWYFINSAPYRMERFSSFLNPWEYATDQGYQLIHSLMAIGTGGIFGTGLGNGYQKLFYLPEPHTDFILSVIGEELGFLGLMMLIFFYVFIFLKGILISRNARDKFGSFLAAGITISIGLQVCINMGAVLGLLPTKGLTLPLLSYGGSSLLINMASIGMLINIKKNS
jgi:cell division protein FtsW